MKRTQNWMMVLLCLALVGAIITGCGGGSRGSGSSNGSGNGVGSGGGSGGGSVGPTTIFLETFDKITELTNIAVDQSLLDNPNSFSASNMSISSVYAGRIPGKLGLDKGSEIAAGTDSFRIAFTVPGLANALAPVLKLTLSNTSAKEINLYVGNLYQDSGKAGEKGQRAYAELKIPPNSDFKEYSVFLLERSFLSSELIQLRPTVTGDDGKATQTGAGGLYLDRIEVIDQGTEDGGGDYEDGEIPVSEGPQPGEAPPEVAAKFGLYGFASVATGGYNGTTGGAGGQVTYVSTGAELQQAINKAMNKYGNPPQIIYVQGEITEANTGAKQIDIKDVKNVSVIGVGTSAVFNGIGINISRAHNIIVQNVTVHHNQIGQKDGISIQDSGSHIWIDHCELYNSLNVGKDYYDELLSAKGNTEYITFSWNYLHDSWKTSLIGKSDSDLHDRKITYHHNLIENCNSRLPSYRGGTGHIYNNYYKRSIETCINSRMGAKLLIENNYFQNCRNPIGAWYSDLPGYWYQSGNVFDNCFTAAGPVTDYDNTCEKFTLPYYYTLETAEQAKASVYAGAGVGKVSGPGPTTSPSPTPTGSTPTPTVTPTPKPTASPVPFNGLYENFDEATIDTFFTAGYKALVSDPSKPMYIDAHEGKKFTFEDGAIILEGSRFTAGDRGTPTTSTTYPDGEFDFTKPYRISFKVTKVGGELGKKFQISVDNNTTSGSNSIHGSDSRVYDKKLSEIAVGSTIELTPTIGTTTSFIMIRVESGGIIGIDDLVIEHLP